MQFKLLNFHKIIARIAANLISCFIPLIVYDATGSIVYALLSIAGAKLSWFIFDMLFKKLYYKYPQIFLLLRTIPFVLLAVSIWLLDYNFIIAIIGIIIFYGMSDAFRFVPSECVFNYNSGSDTGKSNATTRLFEQIGTLLGVIVGGFLLSYISKLLNIILAVVLYLISVIPLVIYYIYHRKDKYLNSEMVSNVVLSNEKNKIKSQIQNKITIKVLLRYFLVYLMFCFCDAFPTMLNLYVFFNNPNAYAYLGIVMSFYNGSYGAFGYIYGSLQSKYDTTKLFVASCLTVAIAMIVAPFVTGSKVLLIYILTVFGSSYSVVTAFVLNRMLLKTRIMGVSNEANFLRCQGSSFAIIITSIVALGGFIPAFVTMGLMATISAIFIPVNEEQTRKMLVDYIQENSTSKKQTAMASLSLRPFGKKFIDKSYKEIDKRPAIIVVKPQENRGRHKKVKPETKIEVKKGKILKEKIQKDKKKR